MGMDWGTMLAMAAAAAGTAATAGALAPAAGAALGGAEAGAAGLAGAEAGSIGSLAAQQGAALGGANSLGVAGAQGGGSGLAGILNPATTGTMGAANGLMAPPGGVLGAQAGIGTGMDIGAGGGVGLDLAQATPGLQPGPLAQAAPGALAGANQVSQMQNAATGLQQAGKVNSMLNPDQAKIMGGMQGAGPDHYPGNPGLALPRGLAGNMQMQQMSAPAARPGLAQLLYGR